MKSISQEDKTILLETLQKRFEMHPVRHPNVQWSEVLERLEANDEKLAILLQMERSEGEPDVVGSRTEEGTFIFMDCSPESPKGRRSVCYDRAALNSRKEHKPKNSAMDLCSEMGIEMLSEEDYRYLQKFGKFDLKTSSWVATPSPIRDLGGALFCDRRYNQVFLYHNGAESYYAARGVRGKVEI
ncbi:DUF4256 domain-containing protein [Litoribacter alkaliphilus]|uniref:DUF4256 domain-containing protein n=1 Tax=Litoribacter ruber TaxID=702568 RepID=A0AAP2CHT1_9BACT|nr:DUF4256 domain-containing protein [Litoribacter alkaliphilus]MBS9522810.1 DUF4256 domain-containing protein [Litoribacter alkaliphilus]